MPGMKTGTGEDPFADEPDPTEQAEGDTSETENDETSVDTEPVSPDENEETEETSTGDGLDKNDIPWVLRRERVKDGRPEMIPVYVREETSAAESDFVRDVEEAVGRDVYKFDVREAAILVAMNHPEEVAAQLNDWGYKYLD